MVGGAVSAFPSGLSAVGANLLPLAQSREEHARGGGIAAVVALCGSVLLAGPAHADQYDFISDLDNSGVYYGSIVDMIDIGK